VLGVPAYYFNFLFYFVDILLLYFLSVLKFLMLCGITIVYTMIQTAGLTQANSVFKLNSLSDYSLNFLRNVIAIRSIPRENKLFCKMAV